MGKESINIEAIINYFKGQPIKTAWLFGSFADGDATRDSDIDILVRYEEEARVGMLKHAEIILNLEELLNRNVDLVPEDSLWDGIKPYVLKQRIKIYERID